MKLLKRFLSMVLALSAISTMSMSAFAADTVESDDSAPRVLQVLIVSESGNELYTGEDAERVFSELNNLQTPTAPAVLDETSIEVSSLPESSIEPNGAFSYKYRFLPDENDGTKVYGSYSIISDPWGNATSVQQSATISFTATSSWSVNCTLTGKYKEVVEGAIGGDWGKEYTVETSHEQNVAPKKRVWLQYRPEYILHSGQAQKYYITRGTGILIVETSKDVDIREAYMRNVTMNGKTYELPAGAYVWCEDSDYMNSNPPVVQN